MHPHSPIADVTAAHRLSLRVDVVRDGAVEHLVLQREVVTAVVGERKKVIAALEMTHPSVLEVVDAAIVVGGDELLRRAGKGGDVAAAILIGVLRVADQRDVAQLEYSLGAAQRRGCRVDRVFRRRARHPAGASLDPCCARIAKLPTIANASATPNIRRISISNPPCT